MVSTRNSALIKAELIRYISSLGLTVNTVTKARGNRGFFKEGRIDVSKLVDDDSAVRVLIHEFAHYINYKLDNKLKSLTAVFGEDNETLRDELLSVTMFVDNNAKCINLNGERDRLKQNIKVLVNTIKETYPDFSATEDFKEFKKYAKGSNLKYLEKYDKVRVTSGFSIKTYSLKEIKKDFPDIPEVFVHYLNLKSDQRRRTKVSRKITQVNKYYNEPCELFARFIEGIYIDMDKTKELAPNAFERFMEFYKKNTYFGLREIFAIVGVII